MKCDLYKTCTQEKKEKKACDNWCCGEWENHPFFDSFVSIGPLLVSAIALHVPFVAKGESDTLAYITAILIAASFIWAIRLLPVSVLKRRREFAIETLRCKNSSSDDTDKHLQLIEEERIRKMYSADIKELNHLLLFPTVIIFVLLTVMLLLVMASYSSVLCFAKAPVGFHAVLIMLSLFSVSLACFLTAAKSLNYCE